MSLVYKDRVSQDCTAPSTTSPFDFDIGGSTPTGFQSFATALATSDTCIYSASDGSGNWEVGIGTWSDTTNALTRTTILASSNAGSAETFSGTVTVEISNDARAMNQNVLPIVDTPVTASDITGVVNTHHVCTIAGITTASKNITIPAGNIGDRIRISVTDGDDAYELIIIGAASQTINGGTAATEWSRLFIAGESVQLVCTAANTWIVEYDGRIPCTGMLTQSITVTGYFVDGSWVDLPADGVAFDVGDICDTTNDYFDLRRAGEYHVSIVAASAENAADQDRFYAQIANDADTTLFLGLWQSAGNSASWIASNASGTISVGASDIGTATGRVRGRARYIATGTNDLDAGNQCKQSIAEIL